jgi:hypothetical protein
MKYYLITYHGAAVLFKVRPQDEDAFLTDYRVWKGMDLQQLPDEAAELMLVLQSPSYTITYKSYLAPWNKRDPRYIIFPIMQHLFEDDPLTQEKIQRKIDREEF